MSSNLSCIPLQQLHAPSISKFLRLSTCTTLRIPAIKLTSRPQHALYSTQPHTPPQPSSQPSPISPANPTLPSLNLFHLLRNSSPAVRYTVYFGLGLMATVESTFWFHVLKAKFFPAKNEEERAKSDEFLGRVSGAVKAARGNWMRNYGAYYGGYVWGVGER